MRLPALAAVLVACSSPARIAPGPTPPPTAPPPTAVRPAIVLPPATSMTSKVVTEDTPWTDADGNGFIVPGGWTVATTRDMTVISPPEGDSHIAFVDVTADSNEAARDAGWKAYKPDATWQVENASDQPDRDGWSRARAYGYQTSPAEKRIVQVGTLFANGRYVVLMIDFAAATAEKRGGQIGKIFDHFQPKGHARESFKGKPVAKLDAAKIEALKKFVADAEAATGVPGVAFGVVQDGKTVWAGGVGVRELGKPQPVDAKTLFMIASNTKALTTLMLAKLVDDKKLAWDAPVTGLLPAFKLGNDEVTKKVQVKHLICACTGMPRQDLEWLLQWKGATPESVLTSLGTMMPTSGFGELFQYSNLMAAAGGYVGGHVAFPKLALGPAYDKAMQALVFDPLGMKATTFDYARALRGDHAMPHGIDIDGKPARALMDENYAIVSARPAGAAWSNVDDMLRYVAMELALGKLPDGKPYIGSDALLARRIPNVAIGADATYGMGLMVKHVHDVTVIHHGGDLIGFHSDMMWLPDANVGAVVLTNGDLGTEIRDQFQRKLLELLYDGAPEADENVATGAKNSFAALAVGRKQLAVPADPAAVGKLAKHYTSPLLGEIAVTQVGGKTIFDFGEFKSEVASSKNPDGTITFSTIATGIAGFAFMAGEADGKPTLTTGDGQHEYVFTSK
jgi:CubicO group peptidase (beta-lactamase class C family)